MEQLSCSSRLVRPFVQLLASYPSFEIKLDARYALRLGDRIRLDRAHAALTHWVNQTGDVALGLKAGALMCFGAGGVLDYAMRSATSIRDSVAVATRFSRLFCDAFSPVLELHGPWALLRLEYKVPPPRVVRDFAMSAWYTNHLRVQLAGATELEVWFGYERPECLDDYRRVFGKSMLRFGAHIDAFAFDAERLDRELASADAAIHAVHCAHLEVLLAGLPDQPRFSTRVQQLMASELRSGRATAPALSRALEMSQRTLVRRLKAEGTNFSEQLDDLRHELALRFLCSLNLPLAEITRLLGFTHVSAFHRAFRRWTGQTPRKYRDRHRRSQFPPINRSPTESW